MPWSPDASTTGGAITGFSSPTFSNVADGAPAVNAKQITVTGLTGCGSATANTVSSPFTATFYRPAALRALPTPHPVSGLRGSIPTNQYKLVVRKGGECAAGVPGQVTVRLTVDVPAGMDTYNPDNVKACVSFLVGLLNEESNDLADTLLTGILP